MRFLAGQLCPRLHNPIDYDADGQFTLSTRFNYATFCVRTRSYVNDRIVAEVSLPLAHPVTTLPK
jgi:hypothetical protein